jgi:hypothetical protein
MRKAAGESSLRLIASSVPGSSAIPVWARGTKECFGRGYPFSLRKAARSVRSNRIGETPLSDRCTKVTESENSLEELAFCKAAGAFGVDPYTCSGDVALFIDEASLMFQNDDLEEFLAGIKPEAGRNAVSWLKQAEQHADDWSLLPAIEDCRREIAFRRTSGAPWTAGYASARKARKHLGLSDSEPVGGLPALTSRLGNSRFRATEPSTSGLRGVSHVQPHKARAIVGGSHNPAGLLFAVTRTFGDAIHFGGRHRSPVTDQQGTYRQMLGRAFAAEFLAPARAVLDMDARGEPIDEIAANFGVSDMVISHQIENRENSLGA